MTWDVNAPGLSADARFIMAYDAGRTLSLMIVRASGYRPRASAGHFNTFLALEAADKRFAIDAEAWIKARHPKLT